MKWSFNQLLATHFGIKGKKEPRMPVGRALVTGTSVTKNYFRIGGSRNPNELCQLTHQCADSQDATPLPSNHFLQGQAGSLCHDMC